MPLDTGLVPARGKRRHLDIYVRDSEHPFLEAVFSYSVSPGTAGEFMHGMSIGPRAETPSNERRVLTVTEIRDLPVARWERAARARLKSLVIEDPALVATQEDIDELRAMVDRVISKQAKKGPLSKRAEREQHLLTIAQEYRRNLMEGVHNPVGEIAVRHKVNPSTARSWIHRARELGFLDPAPGRTAGEATPSTKEDR